MSRAGNVVEFLDTRGIDIVGTAFVAHIVMSIGAIFSAEGLAASVLAATAAGAFTLAVLR